MRVERVGDQQAVLLARRALTARLDREESRHARGDRRDVVASSSTMNAAAPSPEPIACIPSQLAGVSSWSAVMIAAAAPCSTARIVRDRPGAAAERLDDLAQRSCPS